MQDAENSPQLRSRLIKVLDVPPREGARLGARGAGGCNRYACGASAPAALLDNLFEHSRSL